MGRSASGVRRRAGALLSAALVAVLLVGCAAPSGPRPTAQPATSAAASPSPSATGVRSLAVVGDSISVGYNACASLGPCERVNWATGSAVDVRSLATRLGGTPQVTVHDLAVPGAQMRDAAGQVARLAAPVDLVAVLMGANDLCTGSVASMTSTAGFAQQLRGLLAEIDTVAPRATVLLLSVPDVAVLGGVPGVPARVAELRVAAGACGTVLGDREHGVTSADRAAVQARARAYDGVIVSACRARPRCIDDGGALTAYPFGAAEISSLDYFHPSEQGQREIAAIAWAALTRGRA